MIDLVLFCLGIPCDHKHGGKGVGAAKPHFGSGHKPKKEKSWQSDDRQALLRLALEQERQRLGREDLLHRAFLELDDEEWFVSGDDVGLL